MMEKLRAIHNEAMDLAQMAQIATRQGDINKADSLFHQAHLAVTCKLQREAEKLIGLALSGEAPSEIRQDLRQLLTSLDSSTDGQYETYTIQIPSGDKGILNALNLMLTRLGCSMKKIAVL